MSLRIETKTTSLTDTVAALTAASTSPSTTPILSSASKAVLELPFELSEVQAGGTGVTNLQYIIVLEDGTGSVVITADELHDYGDSSTYAARKVAADSIAADITLK